MQRNYRFEIISVSREENFLLCSTDWDKSVYFTPSNLLPKSVVKMKHLTREQRYGISLMLGSNHKGALVTINDRLTSKVWIRKLSGKDATPLALKTIEALQPIKDLIHTITADNGKEFAEHQEIAKELEICFYFCKPYHSWERGANENMNGLIRQYIPKGTDFSEITDEFVTWVENKLNNRPRKRLVISHQIINKCHN